MATAARLDGAASAQRTVKREQLEAIQARLAPGLKLENNAEGTPVISATGASSFQPVEVSPDLADLLVARAATGQISAETVTTDL